MKSLLLAFAVATFSVISASAAEKIPVSSFSSILTEIATEVGGERVDVTAHVKAGVDPHDFEPKPADLQTVSKAALILLSAKHMEPYVGKLKESTGAKGMLLEVGDQFPSLKMKAGGHDHHGHGHGKKDAHDHGSDDAEDPHWWHSISNMQRATRVVRDALSKISPADKKFFAKNADAYIAKLSALQKWTKVKVAELPKDKRKLVTSHEAFQYFARENGFTIYAIEGLSSADEPSSKDVAEMIGTIKKQNVKAVFAEAIQNPKILQEITRESGAKLGGELYADGLGEGAASTYDGMFRHNVTTIVDALK